MGFARDLRKQMTHAEVLLWGRLRGARLPAPKFRRQHPMGPLILDFYCPAARLAVEIDGSSHDVGDPTRDLRRDQWLDSQGVAVVRFRHADVMRDVDEAAFQIHQAVQRRLSSPPAKRGETAAQSAAEGGK